MLGESSVKKWEFQKSPGEEYVKLKKRKEMFVTKKSEDDVVKLRSALSDIKFMAEQALMEKKGVSEKMKSFFDDIIKIVDTGMYEEPKDSMERAREAFNDQKCCGEE